MISTLIGLTVFPVVAAVLARFGLLNTYAGALITYGLTNSITCAVTVYLTIMIASAVPEMYGYSSEPALIGVADMTPETEGAYYKQDNTLATAKEIKKMLMATMMRRAYSIIIAAVVFGHFFPRIPLPALPWWVYIVFFGTLIKYRNDSRYGSKDDVPIEVYLFLAGACWLLAVLFNSMNIPLSTVFIGVAAISSIISAMLGIEKREPKSDGDPCPYINWVEILMLTAVCWVVPGLTTGACSRALGGKPTWLLGLGGMDAILEGWTLGAWFFHGNLSGKTMLGATLQTWAVQDLDVNGGYYLQGSILVIGVSAIIIATATNIIINAALDPVQLEGDVRKILPAIIMIPLVVNLVVVVGNPFALLCIIGLSAAVALLGRSPGARSLVILFVTAG